MKLSKSVHISVTTVFGSFSQKPVFPGSWWGGCDALLSATHRHWKHVQRMPVMLAQLRDPLRVAPAAGMTHGICSRMPALILHCEPEAWCATRSIWPSMEAQVVPLVALSAAVDWDSFSMRNLNRFSAGGWEDWEEAEMAADADGSTGTLLTTCMTIS